LLKRGTGNLVPDDLEDTRTHLHHVEKVRSRDVVQEVLRGCQAAAPPSPSPVCFSACFFLASSARFFLAASRFLRSATSACVSSLSAVTAVSASVSRASPPSLMYRPRLQNRRRSFSLCETRTMVRWLASIRPIAS